jgi:hypothetical protein
VLVPLVDVATAGVGLPDLDELSGYRAAGAVDDTARDDDPLPERLTPVLDGQVGIERTDVSLAEARRPELDDLGVGVLEVLRGVPQHAAAVRRVVQPWLRLLDARPPVAVGDVRDLPAHVRLRRRRGVGGDDHRCVERVVVLDVELDLGGGAHDGHRRGTADQSARLPFHSAEGGRWRGTPQRRGRASPLVPCRSSAPSTSGIGC